MKECRVQMGTLRCKRWRRVGEVEMWGRALTRQNKLPCKQSGKLTLPNLVWEAFVGT